MRNCCECSWGGWSVTRPEALGELEAWWETLHQPCVSLLCSIWWDCAWKFGSSVYERDPDSWGVLTFFSSSVERESRIYLNYYTIFCSNKDSSVWIVFWWLSVFASITCWYKICEEKCWLLSIEMSAGSCFLWVSDCYWEHPLRWLYSSPCGNRLLLSRHVLKLSNVIIILYHISIQVTSLDVYAWLWFLALYWQRCTAFCWRVISRTIRRKQGCLMPLRPSLV